METTFDNDEIRHNPLSDLIPDEVYSLLINKGLINENSVRNYLIKKRFHELRSNKISTGDAIEHIRREYPYLQHDTIRKLVYQQER
ncbi:MAG: hypothetical protein V1773_13520 [bacterium]